MRTYAGDGDNWVDTVNIPGDGEGISERNCAPAWEANADRSAYLKRIMPKLFSVSKIPDAPGYPGVSPVFLYGNSLAAETTIAAELFVDVTECRIGDIIQVSSFAMVTRAGNLTKTFRIDIDATDRVNGTPGTRTHIEGAAWQCEALHADQAGIPFSVSLGGAWTVALAGTTRICFTLFSEELSGGDELRLWEGNIAAVRFGALTL